MSIVKPCLSTLIYIINRYFCEIDICNHMDGSMHIAQVFLILSLRNKEWHIYEILSTCDLFTSCSVLKAFHLFTCCSLKSGQCSYFFSGWMFAFHLSPVHLHLLDCTEWAVLSQEAGWPGEAQWPVQPGLPSSYKPPLGFPSHVSLYQYFTTS